MDSFIRIVIADDHPALTEGLQRLLEIEPDLKVIGQASTAADVVHSVLELKPDILLLDLKMPSQEKAQISGRGGLDAWAAVKRDQVPRLERSSLQLKWRHKRLLRPSSLGSAVSF
jgi:DNA-binding NarL/FixJ family response regulator